jgi:hypothetical protein
MTTPNPTPTPATPNPGSPEAFKAGCTCPRIDNAYGRGALGTSGPDAVFWKTEGCPIHDRKSRKEHHV